MKNLESTFQISGLGSMCPRSTCYLYDAGTLYESWTFISWRVESYGKSQKDLIKTNVLLREIPYQRKTIHKIFIK
jgi:hypothetical protein